MATTPFSVCKEFCAGGGGTNENGIIVVNTEYESADAIPVFTKTGSVAKKLEDVHCGVFKVSFKESKYNGVSTALIFQTTWWGPTNNATENCYQLMYECNGLFRIREEITITVFKTLAWKAIDISNKKTVINNRADDESYPTTLAVKKFVDAHTSNGDIHVTLEDKQKWNDKYTKKEVNSKFALNENGIIEVEYESDKHTIDFSVIRNICKYYDAKGNEIDFSDPHARDKLHTGIYRIKVKSTWEMPEYDDDLNLIGTTKSDSYSEEILVQNVYRYSTKYPDFSVWRNGETVVYQYLFSGNLTGDSLFRSATIKLDGSAEVYYDWASVLSSYEHTGNRVSDISEFINDDEESELLYPNIKAVKDYASPIIINTAEGSLVNITDSANAKLKGLKIFGKTTQEGEPSVEDPQPLVNVGDSGSVTTKVYGANLINDTYITTNPYTVKGITYTKNTDGSITISGTNDGTGASAYNFMYSKGDTVLTLPAGTYYVAPVSNLPSNSTYRINLYDGTTYYALNGRSKNSITLTEETNFIQIYMAINSGDTNTYNSITVYPMLSTTPITEDDFETFKESQVFTLNTPNGLPGVPVTSGGNYTDENGQQWICDEIDLARGKYIERVGEVNSNNSDSFTLINAFYNEGGIVTFNMATPSKRILDCGISSHFISTNIWSVLIKQPYLIHFSVNYIYCSIKAEDVGAEGTETMDELRALVKAWFNKTFSEDNPLIIYYALAEPIETDLDLTEEEISQYKALTTNKPVTNVMNDAVAHMKVDYVADTKNYIDNKFAQLQANILNAIE